MRIDPFKGGRRADAVCLALMALSALAIGGRILASIIFSI